MLKRALNILLVAALALVGFIPAQQAQAADVKSTPGYHQVDGRWWHTTCAMQSSPKVVRCTTDIWGTKAVQSGGKWYKHEGWVFNNITYLPATPETWGNSPLATAGEWTDGNGRQWKTECSASECRTSILASAGHFVGEQYVTEQKWVLNSITQFATGTLAPVTAVPAAAPRPAGVPVEKAFVPPMQPTVYNQPGDHLVNGRYWKTSCSMYSSTVVRCTTNIWGTKVVSANGQYFTKNGWSFNNLTYLPSPEPAWQSNPLGRSGEWTQSGRKWRTECHTPATGRGACRSYIFATLVSYTGGKFVLENKWTFNNLVLFSSTKLAPQTTIPASAPALAGVPVEQDLPEAASFRIDSRCNSGRVLCVSKGQRKLAWMVNGKIVKVVDVRFGSELTPTRNGVFSVYWKSRDHVSSLYHTSMPFAMFFSGGQAIHYSPDFARRGYNGSSHGCVNVRDYAGIKWLFDTQVKTGDKVVVYN